MTPDPDEKAFGASLDLGKPGTFQVSFELLRGRAFRDVRRSCVGRKTAMRFEDGPALFRTEIGIVDVQSAAGSKDACCFEHIIVAVPRLEMHEDNHAVDNIARSIRYSLKMIPGDLPELDVRQIAQSFRRKSQHIGRNITPDPLLAEWRNVPSNPANSATNLQNDITRVNADRFLQGTEGRGSTGQQLRLLRRPGDMELCAVMSIRQRRPHRLVLRSPALLRARLRGIHL